MLETRRWVSASPRDAEAGERSTYALTEWLRGLGIPFTSHQAYYPPLPPENVIVIDGRLSIRNGDSVTVDVVRCECCGHVKSVTLQDRMTDQMTWCAQGCDEPEMHSRCSHEDARTLCRWVNRLGGQARYEPEYSGDPSKPGYARPARIAIEFPNKTTYVYPGDTVIYTGELFSTQMSKSSGGSRRVLLFQVERAS